MSTPISGRPQAMPSARLAHFGPTPLNASSMSRSQGSSPPCSSTACAGDGRGSSAPSARGRCRRRSARRSPPRTARPPRPGCGPRANSRRATGSVVSSRVRIEMMQATRISKTERVPLGGQLEQRRLRVRRGGLAQQADRLLDVERALLVAPFGLPRGFSESLMVALRDGAC